MMRDTITVTYERICEHTGILRIHPARAAVLGDPYVWCTLCVIGASGLVEFKGCDRPVPPGSGPAIDAALRAAGFNRRSYERRAPGRYRRVDKVL